MVTSKRVKIILAIYLLCISFVGLTKEITRPNTFYQSKSIARQLFIAYTGTIYSGCSFDLLRRIDFTTCGFEPNSNIARDKTVFSYKRSF
jgi:endonuclease I